MRPVNQMVTPTKPGNVSYVAVPSKLKGLRFSEAFLITINNMQICSNTTVYGRLIGRSIGNGLSNTTMTIAGIANLFWTAGSIRIRRLS